MLNFLPERQAKVVRRRYAGRLLASAALALALGFAAYGAAAAPAIVVSWRAASTIEAKVAALRESVENRKFAEALAAARALRNDTRVAEGAIAPRLAAALDVVLAKSRPAIAVSSLALARAATSTVVVSVSGVAETREDLLAFVADLDALGGVEAALPVSALARDRSAPFELEVRVAGLAD